jgi:hypothetical protein
MYNFSAAIFLTNTCVLSIFLLQSKHAVQGKVIAIRREDQSVWERRAPFSPANVRRLTRAGVKVIVQPSNRRAYPMQVSQKKVLRLNKFLERFNRPVQIT